MRLAENNEDGYERLWRRSDPNPRYTMVGTSSIITKVKDKRHRPSPKVPLPSYHLPALSPATRARRWGKRTRRGSRWSSTRVTVSGPGVTEKQRKFEFLNQTVFATRPQGWSWILSEQIFPLTCFHFSSTSLPLPRPPARPPSLLAHLG